MKNLLDLKKYLKNQKIKFKEINNQIIINRNDYSFDLIQEIRKIKNNIDVFYLDSTMIFYINLNIIL
jgi:hypothetical protein